MCTVNSGSYISICSFCFLLSWFILDVSHFYFPQAGKKSSCLRAGTIEIARNSGKPRAEMAVIVYSSLAHIILFASRTPTGAFLLISLTVSPLWLLLSIFCTAARGFFFIYFNFGVCYVLDETPQTLPLMNKIQNTLVAVELNCERGCGRLGSDCLSEIPCSNSWATRISFFIYLTSSVP